MLRVLARAIGQTTLATWLADDARDDDNPSARAPSLARWASSRPGDVDKPGSAAFQERLRREKIAWELARDSFVTDRTTLDELVYSGMHGTPTAE